MSNLLALRKRLKTVKNIAKVTKAMQVAAALKMKKAQQAALAGRIFTEKLSEVMTMVGDVSEKDEMGNVIVDLIIVAPDRGLCGSLLSNLQRGLEKWINENSRHSIRAICVNEKAVKIANRLNLDIVGVFDISVSHPDQQKMRSVLAMVNQDLREGKIGKCCLAYMDFVNLMQQKFDVLQMIPLINTHDIKRKEDLVLEPSRSEVVESLIPRARQMMFYQAILETAASEFSARAMAMKAASDNAFDIAGFLSHQYNKTRQSAITAEIAEVVSGTMI